MQKYITLEKKVGETPLVCVETWRASQSELKDTPLAYAGRLDPMASGKLLILIGDECKNQTDYHGLDKAYDFSVLFGIESDTMDVLGRLETCNSQSSDWVRLGLTARSAQSDDSGIAGSTANAKHRSAGTPPNGALQGASPSLTPFADAPAFEAKLSEMIHELVGKIELPYPKFSSKTVKGKPLHTWTLEGRLDEIEIPTKQSEIYKLQLTKTETISRQDLVQQALEKINSIPEVTDPKKALGNDFRRTDVRADWNTVGADDSLPNDYHIAHFHCTASSGTYMRTLASLIAEKLGTCGLAWHIHRTHIGKYNSENRNWDLEY